MRIIYFAIIIILILILAYTYPINKLGNTIGITLLATVAAVHANFTANALISYQLFTGYKLANELHGIANGPGDQSAIKEPTGSYEDNTPLTYIVDAKYRPKYIDILKDWEEIDKKTKPAYVDFILCPSGGSSLLYNTSAKLKARTDSLEITDKVNLHHHLAQIMPESIAKTVEITPETVLPPGAVWMIRANWGWKGRASAVATTTEELQELYRKFSVLPPDWKKPTQPRVIGSEYIMDPMLHNGFKFHLRVQLVLTALKDGTRYLVILPGVYTIMAGKPYTTGNFQDLDIHDTHDARSGKWGSLRDDIIDGNEIYNKIVLLLRGALVPLLHLIKTYPEAENSYDVFGADIMIKSDGTPVLIELNSTPGLVDDPDNPLPNFDDEIINAVFATAFSDVFSSAGDPSRFTRL